MVPMLLKFPEASILVVSPVFNTPPPSIFNPAIVDAAESTSMAVVNTVALVEVALNVQSPVILSVALIWAIFAPSKRSNASICTPFIMYCFPVGILSESERSNLALVLFHVSVSSVTPSSKARTLSASTSSPMVNVSLIVPVMEDMPLPEPKFRNGRMSVMSPGCTATVTFSLGPTATCAITSLSVG